MTWFTSDLHFRHKLVAKLRGFTKEIPDLIGDADEMIAIGDTEAHDAAVIQNWNRVVRPEDTVWVLGDVGMGRLAQFAGSLAQLNGTLHLITGNHDECWPGNRDSFKYQADWLKFFKSVQPFARRRIDGHTVILSHFPYELDHTGESRCDQWRPRNQGEILLHGHLHQWENLRRHGIEIHVGLDVWDMTPVPMPVIQGLIGEIASEKRSRAVDTGS